jgi:hypothetical protein
MEETDDSGENIEQAVADYQQAVVFDLGVWQRA